AFQRAAAARENVTLGPSEIKLIRRGFLGADGLQVSNEFVVNVLDKGARRSLPLKLTLPTLFAAWAPSMGMSVDHLAANDRSILVGGSVSLRKVKVKGQAVDFQITRWVMFIESKEKYFMVEIAYSPQTDSSVKIWDQLGRALESFKIIES